MLEAGGPAARPGRDPGPARDERAQPEAPRPVRDH
jgi:hypothetical protein